ncbi:MAG TPA: EscU/YscU/HrcU family type III secretion system export apparatus switch protein [Longimicrobiales bacterium]|nr:EscU/YscU/HrcU family type III secretion system export apparatus switch protein [Longimicrobiales bacterium]
MSQDPGQERTEAPTPKKRHDTHKKGQVPRSQELNTAFLLLAGAGALASAAAAAAWAVSDVFTAAVRGITALPVGVDANAEMMGALGRRTMAGMAPFLLATSGAALAVGAFQARGVLSLDPLKPDWSRLDPLKRAPQVWGVKAVAELLKSLAKLALVGWVVWSVSGALLPEIPALAQQSPMALLDFIRRHSVRLLLASGLAYLFLALADYAWQVWQHEKNLKMSKQEVRQEIKESEGDQVTKVRRRTMARQMARRRMILAISEADVVVTNPTHIAVALKYDPAVWDAPVVLAMGERKLAERIKERAREHGVPLVENKPLARALLATAKVGHPIPVELFVAVAEILAWVYRKASYAPGMGRARGRNGGDA